MKNFLKYLLIISGIILVILAIMPKENKDNPPTITTPVLYDFIIQGGSHTTFILMHNDTQIEFGEDVLIEGEEYLFSYELEEGYTINSIFINQKNIAFETLPWVFIATKDIEMTFIINQPTPPGEATAFSLTQEVSNADVVVKLFGSEIVVSPGEDVLNKGYQVQITATPHNGYILDEFLINGSNRHFNGCIITVIEDLNIQATAVERTDENCFDINLTIENAELRVVDPIHETLVESLIYTNTYDNVVIRNHQYKFIFIPNDGYELTVTEIDRVVSGIVCGSFVTEITSDLTVTVKAINSTTPASYFNFNDGTLMGFSAEGQEKYDAGEITELVLPATYGIGEVSTQNLRFYELSELDIYCMENGYNFTFVDRSGDIISVTSEDDFYSVMMLIDDIIMTNYSITITAEVPSFIDSKEFVVTEIHPTAFFECTNLISVTLPSTLVKYNYSTFTLCSNLKSINISEKNSVFKSVNGVLYSKDGSILYTAPGGIESFVVPNTVVEIGNSAFEFREKLTKLDFEANSRLEKIGHSAFKHTSLDMDTLIIPRSVKFIETYAFSSLTSSSVIFESGSALESLNERAFSHSSSLVKFVFPAVESVSLWNVFMSNPACLLYDFSAVGSVPVINKGEFLEINDNCKIVVPDELYDSWIIAENWSTFADHIVKASDFVA